VWGLTLRASAPRSDRPAQALLLSLRPLRPWRFLLLAATGRASPLRRPALSDDEARDDIERFLPAYEAYVPPLVAAPTCARWLRVTIGPDRGIVSIVGSGSDDGGGRSAR